MSKDSIRRKNAIIGLLFVLLSALPIVGWGNEQLQETVNVQAWNRY